MSCHQFLPTSHQCCGDTAPGAFACRVSGLPEKSGGISHGLGTSHCECGLSGSVVDGPGTCCAHPPLCTCVPHWEPKQQLRIGERLHCSRVSAKGFCPARPLSVTQVQDLSLCLDRIPITKRGSHACVTVHLLRQCTCWSCGAIVKAHAGAVTDM